MTPQRPLLAGNSLAAELVLDLLLEQWAPEAILVLAPPETGRHSWQPSLGKAARRRDVDVLQPARVNELSVIAEIARRQTDLLLSVYYTQIFKPELLDAVAGPALNFHPSLLPRHRGTAPLIWALIEGDEVAGLSVHVLTPGIDKGPLVYQRPLPIHPGDTGYSLHRKAALHVRSAAAELLRRLVADEGLPEAIEQSGTASFHTSRDPSVNHVQWTDPRARIRNIVRALAPPLPGAYIIARGEHIVLERVEPVARPSTRPPGMLDIDRVTGIPSVWAGDGPVEIRRVRLDGSSVSGEEFCARLGLLDGDQLA